jgi:23S rRNA pseudouridine1911/1915/1917 synthase
MQQEPVIIWQSEHLLALNKPPGMPAQPDPSGGPSALEWAEHTFSQKFHLVHRLDRPVSGLLLLAKDAEAMAAMSLLFQHRLVQKEYLAVVQNPPPETEGHLTHFLQKNAAQNRAKTFETNEKGTMRAELAYRALGSSERYHLLHVELLTGKHHQIRAQLAAIGCPVKGDVKYGARRGNRDRSIHLHAWRLSFRGPYGTEEVRLEAPLPEEPLWQAFAAEL